MVAIKRLERIESYRGVQVRLHKPIELDACETAYTDNEIDVQPGRIPWWLEFLMVAVGLGVVLGPAVAAMLKWKQ